MTRVTREVLKAYFERGDTPTSEQFSQLIDSMINWVDEDLEGISDDPELSSRSPHLLATQRAIRAYIDTQVSQWQTQWREELTGTVCAFAVAQAPSGWLACDGRAIDLSATENEAYLPLYERIGTAFGSGNGNGQSFNLPDLRGEFVRGWNDQSSGPDATRNFGSTQADQLQSHRHTDSGHGHVDHGHSHNLRMYGGYEHGHHYHPVHTRYNTASNFVRSETAHANIGTGHAQLGDPTAGLHGAARHGTETRPRNVALLYCIKY